MNALCLPSAPAPRRPGRPPAMAIQRTADDAATFAGLVQRHRRYMVKLAFRRTRDADAADEMVQRLLEGMWRTYGDLEGGEKPFLIYVAVALKHASMNRTKTAARWQFAELDDDFSHTLTPFELYAMAEKDRALRTAVGRLPKAQREAMVQFLEGSTYKETADALGVTEGAVHDRLKIARENLRSLMTGTKTTEAPKLLRAAPPSTKPNVAEIARKLGLNYATVYARLQKGESIEQIGQRQFGKRTGFDEQREAFRKAFATRPGSWTPLEQRAVRAYYFDGASVAEVAKRIGGTPTGIASTLHHARRRLAGAGADQKERKGRNRKPRAA